MVDKITENHRIVTFEHEMNVENRRLAEKKQKTVIDHKDFENPENSEPKVTTILVHIRSIDNQSVKVTETTKTGQDAPEKTLETDMTEIEVASFDLDWHRLWNPQLGEMDFE